MADAYLAVRESGGEGEPERLALLMVSSRMLLRAVPGRGDRGVWLRLRLIIRASVLWSAKNTPNIYGNTVRLSFSVVASAILASASSAVAPVGSEEVPEIMLLVSGLN